MVDSDRPQRAPGEPMAHYAMRCERWQQPEKYLHELPYAPPASSLQASTTATDGPWSQPDSPKQWARKFGFSTATLMRRFNDRMIRHKKLSSKSYCIHVDDLPK